MGFTNSPLAKIVAISPNRTAPRNQPITKITPHHMAGVMSAQAFCNVVARPSREMSANYGIGYDGTIALTCPEGDRSWCSSSPWNDHRSVTIEVSNSASGGDWPIGAAAYNALIDLCVDICRRNNIPKLVFTGDTSGSLTFHYMYAATACPGPWLKAHAQDLCDKVNARLGSSSSTPLGLYTISLTTGTPIYDIETMKKTGEINASTKYTITEEKTINGAKYGKLKSGAGWVVVEAAKPAEPDKSYTVSLKGSDLLYESAGGRTIGSVGANGVFTIVEDKKVGNTTYGKLKSGAGWVIVKNETPAPTTSTGFKNGDLVKISSSAVYYNGGAIPEWVKRENWYISSIGGDRAVLGLNEAKNRNIQSPINTKYLTKVSGGTTVEPIKVGDWVKVINPIIYGTNKKFTVFVSKYKVLELKGDRAVISSDGRNVTTAIAVSNIAKI